MESKEPVVSSTMPSYGDMSEDDKNKSGLNTLIKKYFAPGGLLIALLIRSATSGSTATASPIMPSGANTSMSTQDLRTPGPTGTTTSTTGTGTLSMDAPSLLRRMADSNAATDPTLNATMGGAEGLASEGLPPEPAPEEAHAQQDPIGTNNGTSTPLRPTRNLQAADETTLQGYFNESIQRSKDIAAEAHRRGHQRLTPRVLTDAQMAAVDAFDQACATQGTPASTSPGSPWLSRIMGGTPSGSSPTSDSSFTASVMMHGLAFARELWDTVAKPTADAILLIADHGSSKVATEIMIKVKASQEKYDKLQSRMSEVYSRMAGTTDRLRRIIGLIQSTEDVIGTSTDIYMNALDMLATSSAPAGSTENITLQQAVTDSKAKMATESANLTGLKETRDSLTTISDTFRMSILDCLTEVISIPSNTSDQTEKSIVTCGKLDTLTELTPSSLIDSPGPAHATTFSTFLSTILRKYPEQLSALVGPIMRVIDERQCGNLKSIPLSLEKALNTIPRASNIIGTGVWTKEYFDKYVEQSANLWDFMCRDFQKCLTECEKPHKIQSTARGGSDGIMVKAGKKDIVTAIFILLHENEKTGWIERNAKREFFAHADTLLASESSLKKAIKILLDAIPDARRIGTKVDFEVIKHCCVTVSRRDTFIFNKTAEEYLAKEFQDGFHAIENDALDILDNFLVEIRSISEDHHVTNLTTSLATAEAITELNICAVKALGTNWRSNTPGNRAGNGGSTNTEGNGNPQGKLKCAMKGCNAKLSDKIEKRALKWAKDKGKSASDHNCLCYKHYKEMVNKDMQGVTDAMHVVLTSSTHSSGERQVILSRKSGEYKAMVKTIEKENAKSESSDQDQPPPSGKRPPAVESPDAEKMSEAFMTFMYKKFQAEQAAQTDSASANPQIEDRATEPVPE
jgi:hypothetical protein